MFWEKRRVPFLRNSLCKGANAVLKESARCIYECVPCILLWKLVLNYFSPLQLSACNCGVFWFKETWHFMKKNPNTKSGTCRTKDCRKPEFVVPINSVWQFLWIRQNVAVQDCQFIRSVEKCITHPSSIQHQLDLSLWQIYLDSSGMWTKPQVITFPAQTQNEFVTLLNSHTHWWKIAGKWNEEMAEAV